MFETLRKSGAIDAMARQLDLPPAVAAVAARQLLPEILESFRRRSSAAGGGEAGLRDLVDMLGVLGGGGLANLVLAREESAIRIGEALLVQLFGSLQRCHDHAEGAGSGLEPSIAYQMQALLAMGVGGYLAARLRGLDLARQGRVALEDLLEPEGE